MGGLFCDVQIVYYVVALSMPWVCKHGAFAAYYVLYIMCWAVASCKRARDRFGHSTMNTILQEYQLLPYCSDPQRFLYT